jgi:hypothetical protein
MGNEKKKEFLIRNPFVKRIERVKCNECDSQLSVAAQRDLREAIQQAKEGKVTHCNTLEEAIQHLESL